MNTESQQQDAWESLAMQEAGNRAKFRESVWKDLEHYMDNNSNPTKYGFSHFLQAKQYIEDTCI